MTLQTEISKVTKEEVIKQTADLNAKIIALEIFDEEGAKNAKTLEKECVALEKFIEEKRTDLTGPLNETLRQINAAAKELAEPIGKAKEAIRKKQVDYANELERQRLAKEREVLEVIGKINAISDELDLELFAVENEGKFEDKRIEVAIETRRAYFIEKRRQDEIRKAQEEEQKRLDEIKKQQGIEAAKIAKEQAEARLRQQQMEAEMEKIKQDTIRKDAERQAEEEAKRREKENASSGVKGLQTVVRFEIIDENKIPRQFLSVDETKIRVALKNGVREIEGLKIWGEKVVR